MDSAPTGHEFLTVAEIATELKLHPVTIRKWINAGILPALGGARGRRVKREDLDAMLAQRPTAQEFLSVEEIAAEFKVHPQTVRNWIKGGVLPAIQTGRAFRVKREDFDAMLAQQQGQNAQLGVFRDPWSPETLGTPVRPRASERPRSVWDGTSDRIELTKRP
jgi:excisionase family DNA binding protein